MAKPRWLWSLATPGPRSHPAVQPQTTRPERPPWDPRRLAPPTSVMCSSPSSVRCPGERKYEGAASWKSL